MQTISNKFQSIDQITLAAVPTEQAAFYLNRRPQTLRAWAMKDGGLIRPMRINGRLAWPVKEIRKILGLEG